MLAKHYNLSLMAIQAAEKKMKYIDHDELQRHIYIVNHIDMVIETLREEEKFIVKKEVAESRKNGWYHGYLSRSTYYRHRQRAYKNFLDCL